MRDDTAVTRNADAPPQPGPAARLGALRAAGRRGPLGLPEIAALAVAGALLLAAVFAYLFLLVPERSRQQSLNTDRETLQRQLLSTQTFVGETMGTQDRVRGILGSLENFELQHLGQSGSGTKTVIEELNRLILKNNLRISGGINFTQLQETVPGSEEARRGSARRGAGNQEGPARIVQSVFPGIGVLLTVEGTYPNLRRFIRDIEGDRRQFVVINTVELEGVTDTNSAALVAPPATNNEAPGAQPAQPQAPTRGALVSLRLDMATYFRRAAASAAASQ